MKIYRVELNEMPDFSQIPDKLSSLITYDNNTRKLEWHGGKMNKRQRRTLETIWNDKPKFKEAVSELYRRTQFDAWRTPIHPAWIMTIISITATLVLLYLLVSMGETDRSDLSRLVKDVIPNLLAALIGFLVSIFLIRHIQKPVEDIINERFDRYAPVGICSEETNCPVELKQLRNNISTFQHSSYAHIKEIYSILLKRIEILKYQLSEISHGTWQLHFPNDNYLTDGDIIYDIITKQLLLDSPDVIVHASTILPYMDWWLSHLGLSYLEAQRNKVGVSRLFLLPPGGIKDVLSDFGNIKITDAIQKEISDNAGTIFVGPFANMPKKRILIVFLLHHCIGIKVKILTPSLCRSDPDELNAKECASRDISVFYSKDTTGRLTPICSVEVKAANLRNIGLIASEAYLYFSDNKTNQNAQMVDNFINSNDSIDFENDILSTNNVDLNNIKTLIEGIIQNRKLQDVQKEISSII